MATQREKVEAALRAHGWTTVRTTVTSVFATKTGATTHAFFALFNRGGNLLFATFDGKTPRPPDVVGQIVTKINAS